MFSQRQIAAAGLMGVYAGCVALTVNLFRLPYRRGAFVGVLFAATMHLLVVLLYISIALLIGSAVGDTLLAAPFTRLSILAACLVCQVLSGIGTTIMGRYFYAPRSSRDPFERQKLYEHLKSLDTGKTSVLHDVVTVMAKTPAPPDRRFSSLWVVFWGLLSAIAHAYWYIILFRASIDALFYGVPTNAAWWLSIVGYFSIGLVVLIVANLASIFWLNRDC